MHQLRERRGRHSNERDGTTVVEGLAPDARDDARSRQHCGGQVVPRRDHGSELLRQHVEAPLMRVDGQPCERTALADSVTLGGKRDVERAGLRLPHLLHLKSAAIILPAHLAAALEASAFAVLRRGHDEDEVVNPRCNVYRLRQASKETSHCTDDAAERAPSGLLAKLAGGESENETVNQDSAQILVAATTARRRCAPADQRVDPSGFVGLARPAGRDDGPPDRAKLTAALGPECQVVDFGDVDGEMKVATVQRTAELRCGGVRNSPIKIEPVERP